MDLLGRYSKRTAWTQRQPRSLEVTPDRGVTTGRVRRAVTVRLTTTQVEALVIGYRSGATIYELAARFGSTGSPRRGTCTDRVYRCVVADSATTRSTPPHGSTNVRPRPEDRGTASQLADGGRLGATANEPP